MWVFADSWFPSVRKKGIIYQSTMPSPTAWKRSSVSGFIGTTCLQSGSFSRALLIQLTKAYFSSSVDTKSIHQFAVQYLYHHFTHKGRTPGGAFPTSVTDQRGRGSQETRKWAEDSNGLGLVNTPSIPLPTRWGCLGHEGRHITETGNEVHGVQMLSSARSNLCFHHNLNAFLYHSAK